MGRPTWGWAGMWAPRGRTWGSWPFAPGPSCRRRRAPSSWPASPRKTEAEAASGSGSKGWEDPQEAGRSLPLTFTARGAAQAGALQPCQERGAKGRGRGPCTPVGRYIWSPAAGLGRTLAGVPGGCRGAGQSSRKPEEMYREKACVPGKEASGLTAEPRVAPGYPDPEL